MSLSQRQGTQAPRVSSTSNRNGDLRVRVKHREYVSEIAGSVGYAAVPFSINPALVSLFPWLGQMASLFESYQFNKLTFQYRTQCATTVTGKALLSVDWDSADAVPATKVAQLQERTKMDDAAWKNFDLPCDIQDLRKFGTQRFTRSGTLAANLDIKTYDVGNLIIGTQGQAATTAIGELWVEYDVELMTPQSGSAAAAGTGAKIVGAVAISDTNILGNIPVITGSAGVVSAVNNTITFIQAGNYLVSVFRTGTVQVPLTVTGTATNVALASVTDAGALNSLAEFKILAAVPGATMIIDASGDATDTASIVRIVAAPVPVTA